MGALRALWRLRYGFGCHTGDEAHGQRRESPGVGADVRQVTEVDIVALKVALEHWQRDAHTWPPPSWDTWDKEQWTRDQLTRVVRGSEALRSRVWQNSSDWGAFWRFQNEVESAVFEFLQALGPPSLQPPWRRSVPITDVELATTLPDHSE